MDQPATVRVHRGTTQAHAGGVVPDAVKFDVAWFDTLPPVEQGAILLAGIYVQDGGDPFDSEEWRETLDALDGADGVDDYTRAMKSPRKLATRRPISTRRFVCTSALVGLDVFLGVIASTLKPGQRTTADFIVAAIDARLAPPSPLP